MILLCLSRAARAHALKKKVVSRRNLANYAASSSYAENPVDSIWTSAMGCFPAFPAAFGFSTKERVHRRISIAAGAILRLVEVAETDIVVFEASLCFTDCHSFASLSRVYCHS